MDDGIDGESKSSSHDEERGEVGAAAPELSSGTAAFPGDNEAGIMDINAADGISSFEKDEHAMIGGAPNANKMDVGPTTPRRIGFDTTQTGLLSEYPKLFRQCNSYTRGMQYSPLAYSGAIDLRFVLWSVEVGGVASTTLCTTLSLCC